MCKKIKDFANNMIFEQTMTDGLNRRFKSSYCGKKSETFKVIYGI